MFKIVLADIEPIQRKTTKMVIEEHFQKKVTVLETDSGQEAFDFVKTKNIDLVILDNRLIDIDGITCVKRIFEIKPKQKILFYTMNADKPTLNKLQQIGINQIIYKPLRPNKFIEIFNQHLTNLVSNNSKKRSTKTIKSIVEFIDKHLNEEITLSFVAEKTDFSTYYLSKVFKKEMGINFVTYVTERKIEKAKELLQNNEIPIINIAFQLGYSEPSYFTKVFKKVEQITPSQYRSQYNLWNSQ